MSNRTYTVSIEFTDMPSDTPLAAAKKALKWVVEDGNLLIWDVKDEMTGKKYTVDLSEDDEDAVLENND